MSAIPFLESIGYVAIGSFLTWLFTQLRIVKPKVEIDFCGSKPQLTASRFLRLEVKNNGRLESRNAITKLRIFDSTDKLLQDGHILHWSRHIPLMSNAPTFLSEQYEPITIAAGDSEYVDCLISTKGLKSGLDNYWGIYSYPFTHPGSYNPTKLPEKGTFTSNTDKIMKVVITYYGDATKPVDLTFYYRLSGDLLEVGIDKSSLASIE